jgi:hypothetical protein
VLTISDRRGEGSMVGRRRLAAESGPWNLHQQFTVSWPPRYLNALVAWSNWYWNHLICPH